MSAFSGSPVSMISAVLRLPGIPMRASSTSSSPLTATMPSFIIPAVSRTAIVRIEQPRAASEATTSSAASRRAACAGRMRGASRVPRIMP